MRLDVRIEASSPLLLTIDCRLSREKSSNERQKPYRMRRETNSGEDLHTKNKGYMMGTSSMAQREKVGQDRVGIDSTNINYTEQ